MEKNKKTRIEKDALGEVSVPSNRYYGAQTQRSYDNFPIGKDIEVMPKEIIEAFAYLKEACCVANNKLLPNKMSDEKVKYIHLACKHILEGKLEQEFPLVVFQTGSGTQTNMNVNEVIANYTNMKLGKNLLHPNDDVNMSQSSNDTFPSAMHIAGAIALQSLITELESFIACIEVLQEKYRDVVKSGRTHLQDAVPITFGQELSGYASSLRVDHEMLLLGLKKLLPLAIGGTAVGTGLNAPKGFDVEVCKRLQNTTKMDFVPSTNKFHSLTSLDEMVFAHSAIKATSMDLMKMANDLRWLASGPRCGLQEIILPANEPGSSIMPGKVNPTQCEQVTQVAAQILGNDTTIGFAASQGNFELNVFLPVTAYNFLQSARLLQQSIASFKTRCVEGIKVNEEKMKENVYQSLMLSTLLSPTIGYDKASMIAKYAYDHNCSLKEATLFYGFLSEEEFDQLYHPEQMV